MTLEKPHKHSQLDLFRVQLKKIISGNHKLYHRSEMID